MGILDRKARKRRARQMERRRWFELRRRPLLPFREPFAASSMSAPLLWGFGPHIRPPGRLVRG